MLEVRNEYALKLKQLNADNKLYSKLRGDRGMVPELPEGNKMQRYSTPRSSFAADK